MLGTVAFTLLQHFCPLNEYPLRSSLLIDQGYWSIAIGMYPSKLNSASRYRIIFLFIKVNLLVAPAATLVALFYVKFNSLLQILYTVD